MLEIRISRERSAACLVVLLCMCIMRISTAQPNRTCTNTVLTGQAQGQSHLINGEIYDRLKEEATLDRVCKLDKTCCSKSAEFSFKMVASGDYKHQVQAALFNHLMPCHNHTLLGEIAKYMQLSKENLVSNMRRTFTIYFQNYEDIFDEFYEYLESSILTGNLCQVKEKFTKISFEVFLAAYVVTSEIQGVGGTLPDTEAFRSCFFNYFLDLRGDKIYNKLSGFLRAYNLTMRYMRALKMVEKVVEGVLEVPLSTQCESALMKMTYCSQCAGYNGDLLPCKGLCLNILRGCLVDLADLVEPVQEFTTAIVNLKNQLNHPYNPWDQITLLNSYFFSTVTETQQSINKISENLFLTCDHQGQRSKRSAPVVKRSAPVLHEEHRSTSENVRERRVVAPRAAPPAPIAEMNSSSYCLSGSLQIFTSLAEKMCDGGNVGDTDTDCWTGVAFGGYERRVFNLNRAAQKNNPEMAVCTKQSSLQEQIAQLKYITRELNIVTGVHICSDNDDEDCVDTVPQTCDYYSFPESYSLEPEEVESSSGSGSGDGFGTEEDDACASINSQISITTSEIEEPDASNTTDDKLLSTDSGAIQQSSATLLTLVLVLVCILCTSCRNYL